MVLLGLVWIYLAGLGASPRLVLTGLDWAYLAGLGASPGSFGYAEPEMAPRPASNPPHVSGLTGQRQIDVSFRTTQRAKAH